MKNLFIGFLLLAMTFGGGRAFLFSMEEEIDKTLVELIEEALENNPKLEAAVQYAQSAQKVISQAGSLPDPQLTLGLSNLPLDRFSFDQDPMTGKVIGIMQMFPFPGKLSLKADMAEFEASAVQYQQEEVRNLIIKRVKRSYFDLYSIDRALETTEKNKALMEQFVHVAETKYATGSGLQQDVLRAQVELSKLEDDLIMWKQRRISVTARLNAILNRPASSTFEKTHPELNLIDNSVIFSSDRIEKTRPLMKAWKERIRKAEAGLKLAERDRWPNFTLGASYRQRNELADGRQLTDFLSATVSLNIPLYSKNKQNAKVSEKTFSLMAVMAEYENVKSHVVSDVESLLAELERNRKRVELYKSGILIQARQSLESAHAGYRVGKVDFLTLINNWMMLQNYELQYFFALADFYKNLADYEFVTGWNTHRDLGSRMLN